MTGNRLDEIINVDPNETVNHAVMINADDWDAMAAVIRAVGRLANEETLNGQISHIIEVVIAYGKFEEGG